MRGILNGVDYADWDPGVDRYIAARYSAANLEGKKQCKKDLLQQFGLPTKDLDVPADRDCLALHRAEGRGLDPGSSRPYDGRESPAWWRSGLESQNTKNCSRELSRRYQRKVAARIAYDNELAHKIEAGSDMFLMPSRYEPCGLNQIYSLRYGTVPVVRATGGLDDTIEDYDAVSGQGTGFKFVEYSGAALLETVQRALGGFRGPGAVGAADAGRHEAGLFLGSLSTGIYETVLRVGGQAGPSRCKRRRAGGAKRTVRKIHRITPERHPIRWTR